jgi:metallo-beta-lactamase family protein
MYQERQYLSRNWDPFPIPPETIDALLVTHAHVDHCGLIPKLVKEGFRGNIYCTKATADIVQIVLLDAARIQEEDAEFKKERHAREGRKGPYPEIPLYTVEDAKASFPYFTAVRYEEPINLGDGVQAIFHDAGHILGSAMIEVAVTQAGERRTIVFSGDVGRKDRPILQDPTLIKQVDYLLIESTYGNRIHEQTLDISENLAEIANSTWKAGGNIVIPSFAVERAQEILYYMNELLIANRIPHLLVFLDSPMAVSVTAVFKSHVELLDTEMTRLMRGGRSPFDFPGLKMVTTAEESKAINHIRGTVMIIAGSGMCNGGRIKHHLVANITRPESTILFVGYQAAGTLGREIVDGARKVRILGQLYPVRARIAQNHGLSAHADRNELFEWLSGLKKAPRTLFVVHGEEESRRDFADFVRTEKHWKVATPDYGEEFILS